MDWHLFVKSAVSSHAQISCHPSWQTWCQQRRIIATSIKEVCFISLTIIFHRLHLNLQIRKNKTEACGAVGQGPSQYPQISLSRLKLSLLNKNLHIPSSFNTFRLRVQPLVKPLAPHHHSVNHFQPWEFGSLWPGEHSQSEVIFELGRLILISRLHDMHQCHYTISSETNIHTSADHLLHQKLSASRKARGMILDQRRKKMQKASKSMSEIRVVKISEPGHLRPERPWSKLIRTPLKFQMPLLRLLPSLAQIWGTQQLRILHSYTSTAHPIRNLPLGRCWRKA